MHGTAPTYGLDPHDLVLCCLMAPDLVCHRAHPDCAHEAPHHIDTCGRFLPPRHSIAPEDPVLSSPQLGHHA